MLVFVGLILASYLQVQAPSGFDAASIKRNASGTSVGSLAAQPGGRFTAVNISLKDLLAYAFKIRAVQIFGGPAWIDSETFDITAVAPPSTTNDQMDPMLRALFAERFKLKTHRETRELPQYDLTIAKNGPKLEKTNPDAPRAMRMRNGEITYSKIDMAGFARMLTIMLGPNVVDKTNLAGDFSVKLEWTPNTDVVGIVGTAAVPQVGDPQGAISIFTAIQDQLGLKLESRKVPTEVLVIDSVDRPSEN